MTNFKFPILSFILFSLVSIGLNANPATGRIRGRVSSVTDGQPLPGTNLLLEGTLMGAAADLGGQFMIGNIPPGDYILDVLNIGYHSQELPITVTSDSTLVLTILMEPKALRSPEIVVTGARRATRKLDSPVTISTIDAADINFRNPVTIDDVLPYEAGVQLLDGQVSMRGSSGYARGAGSRVVVLVDGAPAMSFDNGTIYWDAVPVRNIDRIEILKGPGSALYGSNAMGGVVNIITKAIPPGIQTWISLGGGIYSKPSEEREVWSKHPYLQEEWQVGHSRHFRHLGVSLALTRQTSTGYHQNGWYDRYLVNSELDYAFNQRRSLRSRLQLVLDQHGSFTEWKSPFQPFHTPTNTLDDEIATHKIQWTTQYTNILSAAQSRILRLNVFETRFDNDLLNNQTYSRTRTLNPEFQLNLRPGRRHYLSSGLDFKLHRVDADIWGDHRGLDGAVYLQDDITLTGFMNLTLGGRWDISRVDDDAFQIQINPKLGTTLDLTKHLVLRASLGRGYRAPAMAELFIRARQYIFEVKPNPNLRPETCLSSEVGIYWQGSVATLDMALFNSDYEYLIEPVLDPDDQKIQFRNVTKARIQGFEATADWAWPGIPVTGKVAYTYLDPRDMTADDVLAYRHRHSLVVSQQVAISGNVIAGVDYRYLSRMERVQLYPENPVTGADQRVPIKLLSAYLRYSMDNALDIQLSVENMLQYYYVVIERNMGTPRLLKLRVDYRF